MAVVLTILDPALLISRVVELEIRLVQRSGAEVSHGPAKS